MRDAIVERLPEGPAYFPPDYLTDQPERFLAAELIREQILRDTRQEVPHAVAVLVDRVGGDAQAHPHRRHHLCRTGRAKSHRDRSQGRDAEKNRHAGPP